MGNQRENELALRNALAGFFPARKATTEKAAFDTTPPPMPTRKTYAGGGVETFDGDCYRVVVEDSTVAGADVFLSLSSTTDVTVCYALKAGQILEIEGGAKRVFMVATSAGSFDLRFEPHPYVRTRY